MLESLLHGFFWGSGFAAGIALVITIIAKVFGGDPEATKAPYKMESRGH